MPSEKKKVLIIDDMEGITDLVSSHLQRGGMETYVETDPVEAIQKYNLDNSKEKDIECVICDYNMSGLSGIDVLKKVRQNNPDLPFILYTSQGDENIASRAISMGATDYVQKDSGEEHYYILMNKIESVIDKYRTEKRQMYSLETKTIKQLRQIFTQSNSMDELNNNILEFGSEHLDMSVGFISRKRNNDKMEMVAHRGIDDYKISEKSKLLNTIDRKTDTQQSSFSYPLEDSYCSYAVSSDEPVVISEESDYRSSSYYTDIGISSYIGTKILVDGEVYGTLCFLGLTPYEYTGSDKVFMELLSQWLSYELENRKVRNSLMRQKNSLEEFTSLVRHDLKTPLNTALGHLGLLEEKEQFSDNESLQCVNRAVQSIDDMIDDFTLLSKTTNNISETDKTQLNVAEVSRNVWNDMDINDQDKESELLIDCNEINVSANEGLIEQILLNLFTNAIKHNNDPVTVHIKCTDYGFYVEDDGDGLDSNTNPERIFEKGVTDSEDGTGFGLYITKKIIDLHGWSIDVEDVGSGLRFSIQTTKYGFTNN